MTLINVQNSLLFWTGTTPPDGWIYLFSPLNGGPRPVSNVAQIRGYVDYLYQNSSTMAAAFEQLAAQGPIRIAITVTGALSP